MSYLDGYIDYRYQSLAIGNANVYTIMLMLITLNDKRTCTIFYNYLQFYDFIETNDINVFFSN